MSGEQIEPTLNQVLAVLGYEKEPLPLPAGAFVIRRSERSLGTESEVCRGTAGEVWAALHARGDVTRAYHALSSALQWGVR